MRRVGGRIALSVITILAALFAYFNAGERVAIDFGFAVLYQIPFVALVFGIYLLGMATMYLFGLRHDLRLRRRLREYGLQDLLDVPDPPRARVPTGPPEPDP